MKSKRITQLDGLRAFAVVAVILAHRGLFLSGWVGVDVFFVLSGFLITGILLQSKYDSGAFSHFYKRRAQRILPSYFLCLLWVCFFAWARWGHLVGWYLLFAANLEVALHTSSRLGPWGVYWSLAVEEHFYLLWPLLVLRCRRKTLVITTCTMLLVSPVIRAAALHFLDRWFVYYLTPFRLDGLAIGSLIAVLSTDRGWNERLKVVSLPSAALLPASVILLSFTSYYATAFFNTVGYSLIALGSAGVVVLLVNDTIPWLTRLLQTSILRAIGIISFTLYLIEEPMMHGVDYFARKWNFHHGIRIVMMATLLAVVYATLSGSNFWRKPILSGNRNESCEVCLGPLLLSNSGKINN